MAAGTREFITKVGCWLLPGLYFCLDLYGSSQEGLVMQLMCMIGRHTVTTPLVTADSASNISAQGMAALRSDGANLSGGRDALAASSPR